jgi:hypothetical protein
MESCGYDSFIVCSNKFGTPCDLLSPTPSVLKEVPWAMFGSKVSEKPKY